MTTISFVEVSRFVIEPLRSRCHIRTGPGNPPMHLTTFHVAVCMSDVMAS
jgi:hypothetical protein